MKISFVIDPFFQQNKIFDASNLEVNRDDCQRQYIELRKSLLQKDIRMDTIDLLSIEEADIVFFINVPDDTNPSFRKALSLRKPCYVLINELDLIHKMNKSLNIRQHFHKVFTYQHDLIDNITYFKTNYSFDFSEKLEYFNPKPFREKKLATLIAGYKKLDNPLELYSEREKTIRWFERHHPDQFDLYGSGWNVYTRRLQSLFAKRFSSYQGKVTTKKEVLSNYKFNICYENAKDVPGWITEKIFDSFFAATIPVYWGWKEIEQFVDPKCFIDRTNFKNQKELYLFLKSMSENEFNQYINNIADFLKRVKDDEQYEFGISYFVRTIENQLLEAAK